MDPYVCGKLLTLHWKGNRVDVDALRDRIPLWQDAGKDPKMGSHGNRKLRRWKRTRSGSHRGAHKVAPLGRALHPCRRLMALLACTPSLLGVFWSRKNHPESFIPFGLRLVFLFCETLKQAKNRNWHWT